MEATPLLALAPRAALLLAGLLVPGAAVLHAARLPRTIATCFAGSVLSLYGVALALEFTGTKAGLSTLAAGLATVTLAAGVAARLRRAASEPEAEVRRVPLLTGLGRWLPFYLLFLAAAAVRAWHQPLAGPDIEFRWGFLAEQWLHHGHLGFYPPRSAADFASYFWAESIPPGPAVLHAWAFACAGGSHPAWTVPATFLQLWALHELVWRSAERLGGTTAARVATLAVAACPLLTWSVLIAQETGFTALALAGTTFALLEWRQSRQARWAALAAGFATLGSVAREYGLVFPVLACAALIPARPTGRTCLAFAGVACLGVVWPVRTWLLTGNPVYSLSPGGLFPSNAAFLSWINFDAEALGEPLRTAAGWRGIGRHLALYAAPAVLGWLALAIALARWHRDALLALLALGAVLGLWAASVPFTNGGVFYSLRVTAPALALGGVALGATVASLGSRGALIATSAVAFAVIAALPATLALPVNPLTTPRSLWPAFAPVKPLPRGPDDDTVALLRRVAGPQASAVAVISDDPGFQRRFQPLGTTVIPLWSPQAEWLFNLNLPEAEAMRQWRESRVHYIIVTKWQARLDFLNARTRWNRPPFQSQVLGETATTLLFSIGAIEGRR